jgi:SAM-dependent methyltransferase
MAHMIQDILCCPQCKSSLSFQETLCLCVKCQKEYRISNGKYCFHELSIKEEMHDSVDRIKHKFKAFPSLYNQLLTNIFSPVLNNNISKRFLKYQKGFVINLGSGNNVLGKDVINVDMFDYKNVSIIADIHALPFFAGTVDAVFNIVVLEHVQCPQKVLKEIFRVLKPGGVIFSAIPFMQPYHASPHDYQRYTLKGIRYLHKDFESIESGTYGGPVSGFLWVSQEFLALLFSFGIVPLRNILSLLFMLVTWPAKYFDYFFRKLKTSENIASSFYFYGKKSSMESSDKQ